MKKVNLFLAGLLSLMMIVFGLNKFLQFIPQPPLPEAAMEVMMGFVKSGYIMPIVAVVEILTGILILSNKFRALALLILFPIMLNAFLFHLFLDPAGIGGALVALGINIYLLLLEKDKFSALLKAN